MKTGVRGIHPAAAFVFFSLVFVVTLLTWNPALCAVSIGCALALDIRLRGKRAVLSFFSFVLPACVLITLFNILFAHYGVTVLFTLRSGNNVTLEAFACGLVYAVRTASTVLWLFSFNGIMTQDKVVFLFGKVAPRLALVLSMALRFIPLFFESAQEIEKARRGIGIDSKSGSVVERFKNSLHCFSILVTRSLEHAVDTAASMSARGYALKGRTNCMTYPFRAFDAVLSAVSVVSVICVFGFSKSLYAEYNPVISIAPFSAKGALCCALFFSMCILPLIFDVWEEKLWSTSG